MGKYILLALTCISGLFACKKTQVINKIENIVEIGTYDVSSFAGNTVAERGFVQNYKQLTDQIAKGEPGAIADSISGKSSQSIDYNALKSLTAVKSGDLSIESLAGTEYTTLILDANNGFLQKAAIASKNSHYDPRNSVLETETGGRYRQYSGYLFDKYGMDVREITEKMLFSISYQKVFAELLTVDNISLSNLDKALVYYGAPTSFPNGLSLISGNNIISDQYIALYAAKRDNAYGKGKGGYYSIIKTQFISLQKQLNSNSKNYDVIGARIDSIRINWEKALMATTIHKLGLSLGGFKNLASSDSVFAESLHDFTEAVGILKSFKGLSAKKIVTAEQLNEVLELLYADTFSNSINPLQLSAAPERITDAIAKIKSIYRFSDIQVNSYFLEDDVVNRNIGLRRGE
jgi:hypothetical protein